MLLLDRKLDAPARGSISHNAFPSLAANPYRVKASWKIRAVVLSGDPRLAVLIVHLLLAVGALVALSRALCAL